MYPRKTNCASMREQDYVRLACLVWLKHYNTSQVWAIDSIPNRMEMAASFGAMTLNHTSCDVQSALKQGTEGRGVDVALEVGCLWKRFMFRMVSVARRMLFVCGRCIFSLARRMLFVWEVYFQLSKEDVVCVWEVYFRLSKEDVVCVWEVYFQLSKEDAICVWEVYFQLSKEDGCNN